MANSIRAVDYIAAENMRSGLGSDFRPLVTRTKSGCELDALLAPTVPRAAPLIGAETMDANQGALGEKSVSVRAELIRLNRPANYFRMPAISIPCGFTRTGLPVGLQLIGGWWSDFKVLRIASLYQQTQDWHRRRPPLD
jgi:aspartyl-tRNA(Asn)/glutamyl-tRNA(Gln) amidotransferase subunit A